MHVSSSRTANAPINLQMSWHASALLDYHVVRRNTSWLSSIKPVGRSLQAVRVYHARRLDLQLKEAPIADQPEGSLDTMHVSAHVPMQRSDVGFCEVLLNFLTA